jgi:hypothetical protein
MKLDMLLCLKCFGRMDLVNFSPWLEIEGQCKCSYNTVAAVMNAHLDDDKRVAVFPPSSHVLMRWVFQHATATVSSICRAFGVRIVSYRNSLRT